MVGMRVLTIFYYYTKIKRVKQGLFLVEPKKSVPAQPLSIRRDYGKVERTDAPVYKKMSDMVKDWKKQKSS